MMTLRSYSIVRAASNDRSTSLVRALAVSRARVDTHRRARGAPPARAAPTRVMMPSDAPAARRARGVASRESYARSDVACGSAECDAHRELNARCGRANALARAEDGAKMCVIPDRARGSSTAKFSRRGTSMMSSRCARRRGGWGRDARRRPGPRAVARDDAARVRRSATTSLRV